MAYNMALSIKATSNIEVALVHDISEGAIWPMPQERWSVFDKLIRLDAKHRDAGEIKCNMYQYLPYDENLYLDVDGVVLKDITPLLDELCAKDGYVYADLHGLGMKDEKIDYSMWATNATMWEYFGLGEEDKLPAIQSSYMFIRKNKESKPFFDKVAENYYRGFPKEKLTHKWGNSIPDELIYSGTMAQFKLDVHGGKPVYFGWKLRESVGDVLARFFVLAMYGDKGLVKLRYKELYDNVMLKYARAMGVPHSYKINNLMKGKHANG